MSGNAAPLAGGPPGTELHTVVDELPTADTGDIVPVVLPTMEVGMVPSGVNDIAVVDGVIAEIALGIVDGAGTVGRVMEGGGRAGTAGGGGAGTVEPKTSVMNEVAGCADSVRYAAIPLPVVDAVVIAGVVGAAEADGIVPVVPLMADMDVTGTAGVPGAICPVGVEQVTTVPGIVGSDASGTGASVVSLAPGWVAAENGLGPLSGEVTIVPGVDESPMAVVPMVETCAKLALQPSSTAAVKNSKRRMAINSSAPV